MVRIQPGHTLNITVSQHSEFSRTVVVRRDGTIDYPLLAGIPLVGLTADDVRDLLLPILVRFSTEPEVFVFLSEMRIVDFEVKGEIRNPGRFFQAAPIDLQQALAIGGGTLPEGDTRNILILRMNSDNRRETIEIDMLEMFFEDSLRLPPLIENGDIVVVPKLDKHKYVNIVGMVRMPGRYIPEPDQNVGDLISLAGGVITGDAKEKEIIFISRRNGRVSKQVINIKDMYRYENYQNLPLVQPGDLIIVDKLEFWRKWSWWMLLLRDVTYVLTLYILLRQI